MDGMAAYNIRYIQVHLDYELADKIKVVCWLTDLLFFFSIFMHQVWKSWKGILL